MHLRSELADAARTTARIGWGGVRFHRTAVVDRSAIIFPGAFIGPNVTIGADCVIGPNASIGAPGFGYNKVVRCGYPNCEGNGCSAGCETVWQYRTHTAGVVIEDDVHIGANACVDQGRHRATVIRHGARIDNLVHVGHNVEIGRNALVVALSMLGGTSEVGDGGYVASATLRDHVTVGAGAMVGLGAVVTKDVPANETWAGVPAKRFGHTPATETATVPRSLRTADPAYMPPSRCHACVLSAARGAVVYYCGDCDPRA